MSVVNVIYGLKVHNFFHIRRLSSDKKTRVRVYLIPQYISGECLAVAPTDWGEAYLHL